MPWGKRTSSVQQRVSRPQLGWWYLHWKHASRLTNHRKAIGLDVEHILREEPHRLTTGYETLILDENAMTIESDACESLRPAYNPIDNRLNLALSGSVHPGSLSDEQDSAAPVLIPKWSESLPLTCERLAQLKLWDTSWCCPHCHAQPDDPLEGLFRIAIKEFQVHCCCTVACNLRSHSKP